MCLRDRVIANIILLICGPVRHRYDSYVCLEGKHTLIIMLSRCPPPYLTFPSIPLPEIECLYPYRKELLLTSQSVAKHAKSYTTPLHVNTS